MTQTARVLDVLRIGGGPMTVYELKVRLGTAGLEGWHQSWVYRALRTLVRRGAIKRLGKGVYTLTTGRPHCPHCGGDLG